VHDVKCVIANVHRIRSKLNKPGQLRRHQTLKIKTQEDVP